MNDTLVKIESPQVQVDLLSTGWNLPTTITEEDWKKAGSFLMQVNQARQWWLGDWWNACKWGDGKKACAEIGVDYQMAANCGWVARTFKFSRRHEKLTFTHHQEVCSVKNSSTQDQLLNWCLSGTKRKSVRKLRSKVQEYLEKKEWDDLDANIQVENQELSAAHKRIQELESPRKPDLKNLIPDLMKKYKGASITIGTANRLSCLDEGQQQSFLSIIESKQFEENQNKKLSNEKLKVLEDLAKATRERDEVKLELEKVSTTDTASVLIEKEKELKQIKKEYDRQLIAQRQEAEKTASELHERRFKDQIEQAEKYREKAEKKAKEERERATAAWTRYQEHETEIKNLKNQLDVDNPTNVDNARLKHVEETGSGLFIVINEIKKDMESIGGGMDLSIERLEEIIKKASLEVIKLQETGNEIINV